MTWIWTKWMQSCFWLYPKMEGPNVRICHWKIHIEWTANLKITSSEDLTSVSICSSLFPWSCKRSRFISMTNNRLSCSCSQKTPGLPWVWDGKTETAEQVVLITWFWRRARCSWRAERRLFSIDISSRNSKCLCFALLWSSDRYKRRKHKELENMLCIRDKNAGKKWLVNLRLLLEEWIW